MNIFRKPPKPSHRNARPRLLRRQRRTLRAIRADVTRFVLSQIPTTTYTEGAHVY